MLFFYGLRASTLKVRRLRVQHCPYCDMDNDFTFTTFGRYFHIFWIPIVPVSKPSVAECSHCKKTFAEKEFSPQMRELLVRANHKDPAKRPFWHRIGGIILLIPIVLITILMLFSIFYHTTNSLVTKKVQESTPSSVIDTLETR